MYDEETQVFGTTLYFFGDTHHDSREAQAIYEVCERQEPEVIFAEAEETLYPNRNYTHKTLQDYIENGRCEVIGIDHDATETITEVVDVSESGWDRPDRDELQTSPSRDDIIERREEVDDEHFDVQVEGREEDMVINILNGLRKYEPSHAVVVVGQYHVPPLVTALEEVASLQF